MVKIVFYSKYCVHSRNFLEVFKDSSEAQAFDYVCVDRDLKTRSRHPLVKQMNIFCVPTVVTNNLKLYGKDAFLWLNDQIQINGIASISTRVPSQKKEKLKGIDTEEIFETKDKTKYYEYGKDDEISIVTPDADDIINPDTGEVVYSSSAMERRKKRRGDSLKSKQEENQYYKLLKQKEDILKK